MNINTLISLNHKPFAKIKLITFHCAGGGASNFRSWTNHLIDAIEIFTAVLPGREHLFSKPFCLEINTLIQDICNELVRISNLNENGYLFFGHSLGGLIAFEVSRELRKRGNNLPNYILISSTRPPHLSPSIWLKNESKISQIETLGLYNGTPAEVFKNQELMDILYERLEADRKLYRNYQYTDESPLNTQIITLGGTEDPFVTIHELLAWQKHSIYPIITHFYNGDHFYINQYKSSITEIINKLAICF